MAEIRLQQPHDVLASNWICAMHNKAKITRDKVSGGVEIAIDEPFDDPHARVFTTKIVVERDQPRASIRFDHVYRLFRRTSNNPPAVRWLAYIVYEQSESQACCSYVWLAARTLIVQHELPVKERLATHTQRRDTLKFCRILPIHDALSSGVTIESHLQPQGI
jgi:hypothetical protein